MVNFPASHVLLPEGNPMFEAKHLSLCWLISIDCDCAFQLEYKVIYLVDHEMIWNDICVTFADPYMRIFSWSPKKEETTQWILTPWGGGPHLPLVDRRIRGLVHAPQLLSAILGWGWGVGTESFRSPDISRVRSKSQQDRTSVNTLCASLNGHDSGTDWLEVPSFCKASFLRPMYRNIPKKTGLIWYGTSILGSWIPIEWSTSLTDAMCIWYCALGRNVQNNSLTFQKYSNI